MAKGIDGSTILTREEEKEIPEDDRLCVNYLNYIPRDFSKVKGGYRGQNSSTGNCRLKSSRYYVHESDTCER